MKTARPNRITHRYTQSLNAAPEQVFPLLCPVRELEWARAWNPSLVLSHSGVIEADCVFVTPGESEDTTWIVTRHDPERFRLEMVTVMPDSIVGKLEIVPSLARNHTTAAEIAYSQSPSKNFMLDYKALSPCVGLPQAGVNPTHGESAL